MQKGITQIAIMAITQTSITQIGITQMAISRIGDLSVVGAQCKVGERGSLSSYLLPIPVVYEVYCFHAAVERHNSLT